MVCVGGGGGVGHSGCHGGGVPSWTRKQVNIKSGFGIHSLHMELHIYLDRYVTYILYLMSRLVKSLLLHKQELKLNI